MRKHRFEVIKLQDDLSFELDVAMILAHMA
jgi:hypothetical protein